MCVLRKLSQREMFVPLAHPAGDAQADFGEALVVIGGEEHKAHYSGHRSAAIGRLLRDGLSSRNDGSISGRAQPSLRLFRWGGANILYDNTKLAVAQILGDGTRQETRVFASCRVTTCFRSGSGGPARATTKEKSKGW